MYSYHYVQFIKTQRVLKVKLIWKRIKQDTLNGLLLNMKNCYFFRRRNLNPKVSDCFSIAAS